MTWRGEDGDGKHGGNWRTKRGEEKLLEKKINRDSCQPKKFDYVGSAEATLG